MLTHPDESDAEDEDQQRRQEAVFSLTGTGRVKRKKAFASHILTKKSPKRKRNLRDATLVSKVDEARIKRLIVA